MKRLLCPAIAAAAVLAGAPAAGQTPARPQAPASATAVATAAEPGRLSIGVAADAVAVQKVTGGASGQIGFHLANHLDVFGEGGWLQNVATRRRLDMAALVASALQTSQGKPASSTVEASAFYGGGGLRLLLKAHGRLQPYFTAGAGAARVVLKPAFVLAGADVTANLPQFGVTLGRDLTGERTHPAYTGGFGVQILHGRWYGDLNVRATSIQTDGQSTTVKRAGVGLGVRF